ncbi:MAG: hypothetical protein JWM47_1442 [Acidimicrobiales bacterium]|nr:hypothetical protein [Acidimicrobiales bacterium]
MTTFAALQEYLAREPDRPRGELIEDLDLTVLLFDLDDDQWPTAASLLSEPPLPWLAPLIAALSVGPDERVTPLLLALVLHPDDRMATDAGVGLDDLRNPEDWSASFTPDHRRRVEGLLRSADASSSPPLRRLLADVDGTPLVYSEAERRVEASTSFELLMMNRRQYARVGAKGLLEEEPAIWLPLLTADHRRRLEGGFGPLGRFLRPPEFTAVLAIIDAAGPTSPARSVADRYQPAGPIEADRGLVARLLHRVTGGDTNNHP